MKINKDKLVDLFSYHPPVTEERKQKHSVANKACVDFALTLSEVITDPAELTTLLRKIQEVRMLANQAITYEAEQLSYRDIYIQ